MLEMRDVCKSYGASRILHQVSLELGRGEVIVVRGPSGSGKSSLFRLAAFLDEPDSGSVQVRGEDSEKKKIPWPTIGVLFQQLHLWPHMTLKDNIELPLRSRGIDLRRASALAERLGVAHVLDHFPREASLGQRQRAAIVRAISAMPSYLLLDEPTSALDEESSIVVLKLMAELVRTGTGLLIATHHSQEILNRQFIPKDIFLLSDGSLRRMEIPGRQISVVSNT